MGGNQITGAIPCSENGQDCDNIYARSVAGVEPRANITWFQAQQALTNSGKRLPTIAAWQMAVAGTPDPGDNPGSEDCNTNSGGPEVTGERQNCVSNWDTVDMVGNLEEWVADWLPRGTTAGTCSWGTFSGDLQDICGAVANGAPGALLRGGAYTSGTSAGPLAGRSTVSPWNWFLRGGFRGAR